MRNYLLCVCSCLCLLQTGVSAEECIKAVLAERSTFYVPAGDNLSLSCVVKHCGDTWTGNWIWINSSDHKWLIEEGVRYHLTRRTPSANATQLILNFLQVHKSDEGWYGCRVEWHQGDTDQGHLIYLNVTAAVPSQRSVLHRILVYASATLCLPIILGLARCFSLEVKSQPLPRPLPAHAVVYRDQPHLAPQPPPWCPEPQKHTSFPYKAFRKSQQKTEVVYADISQSALRLQGAIRELAEPTVYSSLRFS